MKRGPKPGTRPAGVPSAVTRARAAWGVLPDWVRAVAEASDAMTQKRVAQLLGCSPTTISELLARRYRGRLEPFEAVTRVVLRPALRECARHDPLAVAGAAWGVPLPDWVQVLAAAAAKRGQAALAGELRYSPAVISSVLRNKYRGDLRRVERMVRGALLGLSVDCPVIGRLRADDCLELQSGLRSLGNPLRARAWDHCRRGCPLSCLKGGSNAR